MIKRLSLIIVFLFSSLILISCGDNNNDNSQEHTHTFSTIWDYDASSHWHYATCGHDVKGQEGEHTFGEWVTTKEATEEATGLKQQTCSVCGYVIEETIAKLSHTHKYSDIWSKDETYHWHATTCGHDELEGVLEKVAHTFGEWVTTKEASEEASGLKQQTCSVCGYVNEETIDKLEHTHKYSDIWSKDETYHWHATTCGHDNVEGVLTKEAHTFCEWVTTKEATEETTGEEKRTCLACGYVETKTLPVLEHVHRFSDTWSFDQYTHWHDSYCVHNIPVLGDQGNHEFTEWAPLIEATEEHNGTEYRYCTVCHYEETRTYYLKSSLDKLRFEETYDSKYNGWCYNVYPNPFTIQGSVIIPSSYNGKPVLIPEYAFENNFRITYLNIETSTDIGKGAFSGTINLETVVFSGSTKKIGEYAFSGSGIKTLSIPDSVTVIEKGAFAGCYDLENVYFGTLKSVPVQCFYDCTNLKSIVLKAWYFYDEAFIYCDSLEKVYYVGHKDNANFIFNTNNDRLQAATFYYLTDNKEEETVEGNWFYFDEEGNVVEKVVINIPIAKPEIFERDGISYIYLGNYPKSLVTDNDLINTLSNISEVNANGYIQYDGNLYAKRTAKTSSSNQAFNDGTKVQNGHDYYFLVEPILWRVLKKDGNNYTLITDEIVDVTVYESYSRSNHYTDSDIRTFLNSTFYNQAFSMSDKQYIIDTNLSHIAYGYDETIIDKVYILEYDDASTLFSSNEDRIAKTNDYVNVVSEFTSYWILYPSSDDNEIMGYVIFYTGGISTRNSSPYVFRADGVRPLITICLE